MSYPIYSVGTLTEHRRQKILHQAAGAQTAEAMPAEAALCLMFGSDFQAADVSEQKSWLEWCERGGNCLLLIPPFGIGKTQLPVEWEAVPVSNVEPEERGTLAKTLASETRYEIVGRLTAAKEIGGLWARYIVHTAYWRRHPHAGLFAVTALPVWSLGALEKKDRLQKFLDDLYALSGTPPADEASESALGFEFAPRHYTVLLHLLTRDFENANEALDALDASALFRLERETSAQALAELAAARFADGGKITEAGRANLEQSEYWFYAEELSQAQI